MPKDYNHLNHGTQINRQDKYGRAILPTLPWLPYVGRTGEPQPSQLVSAVVEGTKFPKLVLSHKETYAFFRPSEFIGIQRRARKRAFSNAPYTIFQELHFLLEHV